LLCFSFHHLEFFLEYCPNLLADPTHRTLVELNLCIKLLLKCKCNIFFKCINRIKGMLRCIHNTSGSSTSLFYPALHTARASSARQGYATVFIWIPKILRKFVYFFWGNLVVT
jgi:hypothetical protein